MTISDDSARVPVEKFKPVSNNVLRAWAWKLRHAHVEAEAAANRWRVRNDELNEYVKKNPSAFHEVTYTARDFKSNDFELSDAMSQINFWGNEQKRIQSLIAGEKDLRELLRRDYLEVPRD